MKISIITACYNSEKYIKDTIKSILNQTYQNIEYIIIDGKSIDNTVNIIKEFEPKFNSRLKWITEPDTGIYDAMNKGIKLATGDIIGILNSDDIYLNNNVISKIVNIFANNDTDSIFANLYFVDSNDTKKIVRTWKSSSYIPYSFSKGWHPPHPTFFVKRDYYDKYGDFDTTFQISADFELMLRFIEKFQIKTYFLDEFIVAMRYGGESTKSIGKIVTGNKNIIKAFKKNNIKISIFYPIIRLYPKLKNKISHLFKT
jgi:glycosyltransferase involved in cell wall biosynthesis